MSVVSSPEEMAQCLQKFIVGGVVPTIGNTNVVFPTFPYAGFLPDGLRSFIMRLALHAGD
jgi:hypothetical protein